MLKIKIMYGLLKNRAILIPKLLNMKPTRYLIKQSIFNVMGIKKNSIYCLDLFCGSGSLGIECLSMGVSFVRFIDINPNVIKVLKGNLYRLGFNFFSYEVLRVDALNYLYCDKLFYDIIFLDPPYKLHFKIDKIIINLYGKLKTGGYLYYECSNKNLNLNIFCKLFFIIKVGFRGRLSYILLKKI